MGQRRERNRWQFRMFRRWFRSSFRLPLRVPCVPSRSDSLAPAIQLDLSSPLHARTPRRCLLIPVALPLLRWDGEREIHCGSQRFFLLIRNVLSDSPMWSKRPRVAKVRFFLAETILIGRYNLTRLSSGSDKLRLCKIGSKQVDDSPSIQILPHHAL